MEKRIISTSSCVDIQSDEKAAIALDYKIAKFIVKKKRISVAKSFRLGTLWEILDPLFISMVYLFVFTVIRHNPNTGSLVVGIVLMQGMQKNMVYGASSNLDYSSTLVIERIRSRAIIFSELIYVTQLSLRLSIGAICVCLILGISIWATLWIPIFCLVNGLMWYSFGRMLVPIVNAINDFKNILTYFTMMMFFVSPVLYPLSATSGIHRTFNLYNPFTYIVEPLREFLFDTNSIELLNQTFMILLIPLGAISLIYGLYTIDKQRWRWSTWS